MICRTTPLEQCYLSSGKYPPSLDVSELCTAILEGGSGGNLKKRGGIQQEREGIVSLKFNRSIGGQKPWTRIILNTGIYHNPFCIL